MKILYIIYLYGKQVSFSSRTATLAGDLFANRYIRHITLVYFFIARLPCSFIFLLIFHSYWFPLLRQRCHIVYMHRYIWYIQILYITVIKQLLLGTPYRCNNIAHSQESKWENAFRVWQQASCWVLVYNAFELSDKCWPWQTEKFNVFPFKYIYNTIWR